MLNFGERHLRRTIGDYARMVTLQAFNGSVALTGLLLAAITTERNRAFQVLEFGWRRLSDLATELDR